MIVESGGTVQLSQTDITGNATPLVENSGSFTVSKKAGSNSSLKIQTTGNGAAVSNTATGTLQVVDYAVKSAATDENQTAVQLAGGSKVIVGSNTITVASNAADGENYIDNNGTIHLSSGATVAADGGSTETLDLGGTVTLSGAVNKTLPDATDVTLDQETLSLTTGSTGTLKATVKPPAALQAVTWSSSDETVATVDEKGVVTAEAPGTATITASAGEGINATCTVTVTTPVTGVTLDQETLSLTTGSTGTLKATVKPENATNQTVTWSSSDETVATVDEKGVVTAVSAGTATITATATNGTESKEDDKSDSCTVTVTKRSSNSGSPTTTTTTTTTTNSDGSQTTTTTDKATGTTTSTTTGKDGATTTVETKKDGTVTTTNKTAQGVTTSAVTGQDGVITAQTAVVPESQKDEAVTLPVDSSAPVAVQVQGGGSAKVSIPAEDATPGTVAILVKEDGTEEVIKTSVSVDGTVVFDVEGNATIRIADNSKDFDDVADTSWENDAVDFVSARSIFNGTSAKTFTPDGTMTRGMLAQVLHNLEDNPQTNVEANFGDVHDQAWYADAVDWAASQGIVQGYGNGKFGPNDNITREQLAVMLYRYAGSPAVETDSLAFTDADQVSAYAQQAMVWATQSGVISGKPGGVLDPKGDATRAETAQMLMNYLTR
jgi:uncharacterized protein YjdB